MPVKEPVFRVSKPAGLPREKEQVRGQPQSDALSRAVSYPHTVSCTVKRAMAEEAVKIDKEEARRLAAAHPPKGKAKRSGA